MISPPPNKVTPAAVPMSVPPKKPLRKETTSKVAACAADGADKNKSRANHTARFLTRSFRSDFSSLEDDKSCCRVVEQDEVEQNNDSVRLGS